MKVGRMVRWESKSKDKGLHEEGEVVTLIYIS